MWGCCEHTHTHIYTEREREREREEGRMMVASARSGAASTSASRSSSAYRKGTARAVGARRARPVVAVSSRDEQPVARSRGTLAIRYGIYNTCQRIDNSGLRRWFHLRRMSTCTVRTNTHNIIPHVYSRTHTLIAGRAVRATARRHLTRRGWCSSSATRRTQAHRRRRLRSSRVVSSS